MNPTSAFRRSCKRVLLVGGLAGMVAMGGIGSLPVAEILALVNTLANMGAS